MFNGNYCSVGTAARSRSRVSRSEDSEAKTRRAPPRSIVGRSSKERTTRRKSRRSVLTKMPASKPVELEIKVETAFQPSIVSTPAQAQVIPESMPAHEGAASALAAYLRDVGQVDLLTPQQEVELAARIQKGDNAAREHMIRANLRLVVKIARDYEHLGLPLLDLISEGTIGLMKAVDRFDPAKGGKLSTYGSWWIKQQIRRALANQGRTIRLPVHVEAKIYRLGRAEARLREEFGREASDEELAAELGVETRKISRLRDSAVRPGSLDAPLGEDDSSTVGEIVRDERASSPYELFEQKADHTLLRSMLQKLPERESRILKARFGLDGADEHTLEELGEQFGLTRERIRQLQNEAFKKLRHMLQQSPRLSAAA